MLNNIECLILKPIFRKGMKKSLFLIGFVMIINNLIAQKLEDLRLMRFPTISDKYIAFSYAGDIYIVSREGGVARRLTSGDGYEMFPRFSPDGKWLAFTGQYDGNTEVYIMPAEGGVPKRLTYTATLSRDDISDRMGPNNIVIGWTPDGKKIIYRSRGKSFNDFIGHLYMVSIEGGVPEQLPFSTGGFCSFSPDGKKIAFNRVFREFRTWKYYMGGMADDIRIFDFETKKIENITNNVHQDIIPMWIGDEIYFLSDRDKVMNLFCYNTKTGETRKVTNFTDYDIKFPSSNGKEIIFEKGGYLYVFDPKSQEVKKITVTIANDFRFSGKELIDATPYIQMATLSPGGERLAVVARGEVFSVPSKSGVTRNLTNNSGSNDRNAAWSPDGKTIAFISDRSGEFEIWTVSQDGTQPPKQITKGADTYYYSLVWSPDGKKILFNDKKLRLRYVDVATGKITEVAQSGVWEYSQFNWSPDSKWIVYVEPQKTGMNQVMIYEVATGKKIEVTNTWYESYSPSFSPDGKYLLLVSDRDFNPVYSQTEWNHAYTNMAKVYLVILSSKTPNPLGPENDEIGSTEPSSSKETKETSNEKSTSKESVSVEIDPDNIQQRIVALPIQPSNYWNPNMVDKQIYYMKKGELEEKATLMMYDLEKRKEVVITAADDYEISRNGKKMLIVKEGKYYVIDLPKDEVKLEKPVSLENVKCIVDRQAEWRQIYYEAWRQMRDFFYVPNMHGVDWEKIRDKYAVLLPYVNNRHDLNYIIGEMIAELNVGHAYIGGGDTPKPKRIPMGLLGADVIKDPSGYFKVTNILKGENWSERLRSPLTEIGVEVKPGEFILSIDGVSTKDVNNIYELLIGKADKLVEMWVNSTPSMTGARKVFVRPLSSEADLIYYNWVQKNIAYVDKKTNGQVGYIHIPDMGVEGLNEFAKYFYPQLNKKALIIDDRGNGGGNVSPMIMERLMRIPTRANMARNVTVPGQTPTKLMLGPKVLLINQYSASDGDLFPYAFKKHKLGKVIGVRSWGGVVGIRGSLYFVDGTTLNKPEFASYDIDESKWIIEGWGVDPDIVVDNDPYEEFMGKDAQLDKAIEVILEELKNYKPIPPIPEAPDKSH